MSQPMTGILCFWERCFHIRKSLRKWHAHARFYQQFLFALHRSMKWCCTPVRALSRGSRTGQKTEILDRSSSVDMTPPVAIIHGVCSISFDGFCVKLQGLLEFFFLHRLVAYNKSKRTLSAERCFHQSVPVSVALHQPSVLCFSAFSLSTGCVAFFCVVERPIAETPASNTAGRSFWSWYVLSSRLTLNTVSRHCVATVSEQHDNQRRLPNTTWHTNVFHVRSTRTRILDSSIQW